MKINMQVKVDLEGYEFQVLDIFCNQYQYGIIVENCCELGLILYFVSY